MNNDTFKDSNYNIFMINFFKKTTETFLKRKIVNQNDTNQVY